MIGGLTTGVGGPIIAGYLATLGDNDSVMLTGTRGLLADTLPDLVAELGARAARGCSPRPVLHVYASPPPDRPDWSPVDWAWYWLQFEQEFDLVGQPFIEVSHSKAGREHRHRLYLRVRRDGSCVGLSHSFPRQEYLSRRTEHHQGAPMVAGRFNRSVAHRLRAEGRSEIADGMEAAGLLDRVRPSAASTRARRQAARTGVAIPAVEAAVLAAWRTGDAPPLFASLAGQGLRLEHGSRAIVVRDEAGGIHGLRGLLDRACRADGMPGVLLATLQARLSPTQWPAARSLEHAHVETVNEPSESGIAIRTGEVLDDAVHSPTATIAYTAAMAGYDVRRDGAIRQVWLDRAQRDEYDTGWLPGPVAAAITSIHLVPGRVIVVLDLDGGGTISDGFSRVSYRGPRELMPPSEWQFALSRRGWPRLHFESHRGYRVGDLERTEPSPVPKRRR